jgi:hypothetical protein
VEANIKYLPLYPETKGCDFNEDFFKNHPNYLKDFMPNRSEYSDVIKVVKTSDFLGGGSLCVYMDGESGKAVSFVKNDDFEE